MLQGCTFYGPVEFQYLNVGYVWVWLVWIASYLLVSRTRIVTGSFSTYPDARDIGAAVVPFGLICTGLYFRNVKVEGFLSLASVKLEADLDIDDIEVGDSFIIGAADSPVSRMSRALIRACTVSGTMKVTNIAMGELHVRGSKAVVLLLGQGHGGSESLCWHA
jgi:hypothetical protein